MIALGQPADSPAVSAVEVCGADEVELGVDPEDAVGGLQGHNSIQSQITFQHRVTLLNYKSSPLYSSACGDVYFFLDPVSVNRLKTKWTKHLQGF